MGGYDYRESPLVSESERVSWERRFAAMPIVAAPRDRDEDYLRRRNAELQAENDQLKVIKYAGCTRAHENVLCSAEMERNQLRRKVDDQSLTIGQQAAQLEDLKKQLAARSLQ